MYEREIEPRDAATYDQVTKIPPQLRGPTRQANFPSRLRRDEIPVVARSLTELFERALACDGKLDFTPIGYLSFDG